MMSLVNRCRQDGHSGFCNMHKATYVPWGIMGKERYVQQGIGMMDDRTRLFLVAADLKRGGFRHRECV
jgi:hypothetical protein